MLRMSQKSGMAFLAIAEEQVLQLIDRLSPGDGGLQGQTWTKSSILGDSVLDENSSGSESTFVSLLMKHRRSGSNEICSLSHEIDSRLTDVHHGTSFDEGGKAPEGSFTYFPLLLLQAPRRFFWLAVLASVAIPITSAENPILYVDLAVWAFGILANVPSIYVLANPSLSPGGDGRSNDTIWTIARGWSVSFGPVFALVFVMLLRIKLVREKRRIFVLFLFVVSLLGILMLMLFTRDGWWSVLDLLSICVSWCAVASYIIVDELRGITAAVTDYEGRIESSQRLQRSRDESAEDDDLHLETGRASLHSDGMFTIGDDSTLGDRATHADSP